jgi:hypothetical protein
MLGDPIYDSDSEVIPMASIVIKDLPDSIDLDRQAMTAITGGARIRGRQAAVGRTTFRDDRVVNFPDFRTGAAPRPTPDSKERK